MRSIRLHLTGLTLLGTLIFWLAGAGSAQTPEQADQERLERGARLFAENCAVCHGADGQGRVGATLARDWPSIRPDLRVQATIARGVEGSVMPAWSQENGGPLTEAEIGDLVYYILSWQTGGPLVFVPTTPPATRAILTPPPQVTGDPNRGALLYEQNCAVCHGPNGEGRVGATLARDWPSIRPDLQVQATIARGVEGSVMPAWSQENGGPLTEAEIGDLAAFLLTWSTPPNPPSLEATPAAAAAPWQGWQAWLIFGVAAILLLGGAFLAVRRRRG